MLPWQQVTLKSWFVQQYLAIKVITLIESNTENKGQVLP